MFQLILGAILGTMASLIIAHFYYKRSSQDIQRETDDLKKEIVNLKVLTGDLQEAICNIWEIAEITKKHVVAGTPDDPDFPYK